MKQAEFIERHRPGWEQFEATLTDIERRKRLAPEAADAFAARYRELCQHLSLARARGYGRDLCEYLHALSLRGHRSLHARRPWLDRSVSDIVVGMYPRLIRRHWRPVLVSTLLFMGSFGVMLIGTQLNDELIYRIADPAQVAQFEAMYTPSADRVGPERDSATDFVAFANYLRHNTTIGFQTFAGGLLGCIGTLFYLLFNGIFIGAIAGHITSVGSGVPFWSFVSGHSAFELTAIALSGAAGLRLGWSMIAPGNRTRRRALREGAQAGVQIMLGAMALFALAAVVEGFWSAMGGIPAGVKYGVGIALWALTLGWLGFGGRRSALPSGQRAEGND